MDYISFVDIINRSCSISLENLSSEEINFAVDNLKSSSLRHRNTDVDSTSTQSTSISTHSEYEKKDPTYGAEKVKKPSHRPGRKPSAVRLAAQKLINKRHGKKGASKTKDKGVTYYPCKPSTSYSRKKGSKVVKTGKVSGSLNQDKADRQNVKDKSDLPKTADALDADPPKPKKRKHTKTGLKLMHHGLKRPKVEKRGRRCRCEMCGEVFATSTEFITHYSMTHPALPCKDFSKVFSNPLSLQKHRYEHIGKSYPCDMCERTLPFVSKLRDHKKSHFKQKPHVCSYPNCNAEATHLYDMKKHERTHCKKKLVCRWCTYDTNDKRNLVQHQRIHTGEQPYERGKCHKRFTFSAQKTRHSC